MALILNIHTATEDGGICLALEGRLLAMEENNRQQDHAAWLHLAIQRLLQQTGYTTGDLAAVAVTEGPGSYTGLRVGMATAKGLCYALRIPLIVENTLMVMARATFRELELSGKNPMVLLCPMIDARRMEVFTALYNTDFNIILAPKALILQEDSFEDYLLTQPVIFFGNGSHKYRSMLQHPNAFFEETGNVTGQMAAVSWFKWQRGEMADLAYSEPVYGKEFFTHSPK